MIARSHIACADVEPLLSACADGELVGEDALLVRAHVASCARCRARLDDVERLKRLVAHAARNDEPELPAGLLGDIRASIHGEARRERRRKLALSAGVLGVAAAAVLAVVAGPALHGTRAAAPSPRLIAPLVPRVVDAVVARHRLDVPVDVASPDPVRVQQFLAARVGHGVRVPKLEPVGFGLQGGRVVDVDEKRGAQLVYTGGFGQRLSVVALPDPDGALAATFASNGGHAFTASQEGLGVRVVAEDGAVYGVVGDVDDSHLDSIVDAIAR